MATPAAGTPRSRARLQLVGEIKDVARRQLAQDGPAALSMRSIARDLGLGSASALYRYFPSKDAILTALIIDAYDDLGAAAEQAHAPAGQRSVLDRWMAICHGVRAWSLDHPQEYALIFGAPVPGFEAPTDTVGPAARVPALLTGLLAELVATGGYDLTGQLAISDDVHRALSPVREMSPPGIPDELIVRGLMAWTHLFGALSFEVFGHRRDIISDPAPYFDHEMRTVAVALGIATTPADH